MDKKTNIRLTNGIDELIMVDEINFKYNIYITYMSKITITGSVLP